MVSRLLLLLLVPVLTLLPASKKSVATAKGENEDLSLTVTLHLDPADIKELIGNDLGGHYFVAEVKVEPKYGKDVTLDRDDFVLRTDKDGEKATPFAPSQVAGRGALVISEQTDNTGVGSPGWHGAVTPVIVGGGATASHDSAKDGKAAVQSSQNQDPLKKVLDAKVLPEGKTSKPVTGLLYFPMEKQKMKDLELLYGGKENRISLRFKP